MGVWRMDKVKRKPRNTKDKDNGKFLPVIAEEKKPEVIADAIQQYVSGVSVQDIAKQYGVDRGIIYDWMLGGLGPENYESLVTRVLVKRVREADTMLEKAEEPHHIARAREIARFARMDLERRRPHIYGQKQEVANSAPIQINIGIARSGEIDVTP
jgi:transposase-like protein